MMPFKPSGLILKVIQKTYSALRAFLLHVFVAFIMGRYPSYSTLSFPLMIVLSFFGVCSRRRESQNSVWRRSRDFCEKGVRLFDVPLLLRA
jgi:hypothetical protein